MAQYDTLEADMQLSHSVTASIGVFIPEACSTECTRYQLLETVSKAVFVANRKWNEKQVTFDHKFYESCLEGTALNDFPKHSYVTCLHSST